MVQRGAKFETELKGKTFASLLLRWNREENHRQMPWKGESDPYKIWLSEIILQQTRVEQGLKYYNRFIATFPQVGGLAAAPEAQVFKLWEGLGYYSRCRNLIATARYIAGERNGQFPATYEEIRALKGIGPYTAAAIASFAFSLPHAVVDGNVFRVLSRVFGISTPIDSTAGKKYFTTLAQELLDKKQPGRYNQAIMDFGATVCKPVAPLCPVCPFRHDCYAFLHGKVEALPVKEKKIRIKKRWFYYLVAEYKGQTAIRQRTGRDIWQQLCEFPLIEADREQDSGSIIALAEKQGWLQQGKYSVVAVSPLFRQQLSHQLIAGQFISIKLKSKPAAEEGWLWVSKDKMGSYAFPRLINQYLETPQQGLF
ncbi:MAG: A/G-specific adenine glycosylase [Chitinophagaceae bacterium]